MWMDDIHAMLARYDHLSDSMPSKTPTWYNDDRCVHRLIARDNLHIKEVRIRDLATHSIDHVLVQVLRERHSVFVDAVAHDVDRATLQLPYKVRQIPGAHQLVNAFVNVNHSNCNHTDNSLPWYSFDIPKQFANVLRSCGYTEPSTVHVTQTSNSSLRIVSQYPVKYSALQREILPHFALLMDTLYPLSDDEHHDGWTSNLSCYDAGLLAFSPSRDRENTRLCDFEAKGDDNDGIRLELASSSIYTVYPKQPYTRPCCRGLPETHASRERYEELAATSSLVNKWRSLTTSSCAVGRFAGRHPPRWNGTRHMRTIGMAMDNGKDLTSGDLHFLWNSPACGGRKCATSADVSMWAVVDEDGDTLLHVHVRVGYW